MAAAADDRSASRDLLAGRRLVDKKEFAQAIPRLTAAVSANPGSASGIEALYYLGVANQEIGAADNAQRYLNLYLQSSPKGGRADDARKRLDALNAAHPPQGTAKPGEDRIAAAAGKAAADPSNMAAQLEWANALWQAGRYAETAKIYENALAAQPDLANDATLRSRVERGADGKLVLLTPEEVARRYAEAQPLLVVNTRSFTSGRQTREARSGQDIYYNVSGEAVNRGQKPLGDVRVSVTIYGFGDAIFDTQTVAMGTMRPGDKRPFSVRFANFDNINNVSRFSCDAAYDR